VINRGHLQAISGEAEAISAWHGLHYCAAVSRHPDTLVLSTIPADIASHVRGIAAVLDVISAGCRQGCLNPGRPHFVS
jgi:hypothetical protein